MELKIKIPLREFQKTITSLKQIPQESITDSVFLNQTGIEIEKAGKRRILDRLTPPLSQRYLKQKLSQGYSSKPLLRTTGKDSITKRVSRKRLQIGAKSYMISHNFGRVRGVPKREYLGVFKSNEIDKISKLLGTSTNKVIKLLIRNNTRRKIK